MCAQKITSVVGSRASMYRGVSFRVKLKEKKTVHFTLTGIEVVSQ